MINEILILTSFCSSFGLLVLCCHYAERMTALKMYRKYISDREDRLIFTSDELYDFLVELHPKIASEFVKMKRANG